MPIFVIPQDKECNIWFDFKINLIFSQTTTYFLLRWTIMAPFFGDKMRTQPLLVA